MRNSRWRSPFLASYGIIQDPNRKGFLIDDPNPGRRCLRMKLHKDINHCPMPPSVYSTYCPREYYNRHKVTEGDCVRAARAILAAKYPGSVDATLSGSVETQTPSSQTHVVRVGNEQTNTEQA